MNDRELLELAAKAAGYEVSIAMGGGSWINDGSRIWPKWEPITDDGAALRLAIKLHLNIEFIEECDTIYVSGSDEATKHIVVVVALGDIELRRAIVMAASEIGRSIP